MEPFAAELVWVIQPLSDAGLSLETIRTLLFDLGFEAAVSDGCPTVTSIRALVADQPAEIQAAWSEVIGRMIALTEARPDV